MAKHPYLLDKEGYAIIEEVEPPLLNAVCSKYVKLADRGLLTKDHILKMEYTDIIRLATHPKAEKLVWDTLSIRPVPMRWGVDKNREPLSTPYQIRPYQQNVINWMREREMKSPDIYGFRGGIISLRMGLGKSLISLVHSLSSEKGEFPTLIVASKTMVAEWRFEAIEKFFGSNIKVLYIHKDISSPKELELINRTYIKKHDIVITSYDVCRSACKLGKYNEQCYTMGDKHTLMKGKIAEIHLRTRKEADLPHIKGIEVIFGTPWRRVICDESQTFANPTAKIYHTVMAIYGDYKWCLTGTPIRNYSTDIWTQFRYCGYNGCSTARDWKRKSNSLFITHFLKEAILSMGYEDAKITLPPKTKNNKHVSLTGKELSIYKIVFKRTQDAYGDLLKGIGNYAHVLAMFTRLRQCAIAPYLMTAESKREKLIGVAKKADDIAKKLLVTNDRDDLGLWVHDKKGESGINSAKMIEIINIIKSIPSGQKMLIFSMFTSCLDLLADALEEKLPEFKYLQVDGDTIGEERSRLIRTFKTDDSVRGLLLTYKVGSEGLNLTEACHCIFIEPWWTNAVHNQAEARIWRSGQMHPVTTHMVLVKNSIEERVMEICQQKDELASSFLDGTNKSGKVGLDIYTMGRLLEYH